MREIVIFLCVLGSLFVGIIWFAVTSDQKATLSTSNFNVICLDGVEYWYRQSGYKGMLAVRYDENGSIRSCKSE